MGRRFTGALGETVHHGEQKAAVFRFRFVHSQDILPFEYGRDALAWMGVGVS